MGKTNEICAVLRKELEEGRYPEGTRFPSEYELAERFGVNKITTNKAVGVLVGLGLLSRGKRGAGTRVLNAGVFPRGLIAFIGNIEHPYVSSLLNGAQQMALTRGYAVCVIAPHPETLDRYLDGIRNSRFIGVLAISYGTLPQTPLPVIYFDRYKETLSRVNCNNYQGGRLMMEAVFARGHRDIAVFTSDPAAENREKRIRAFHDVMREHGVRDAGERTFCSHTSLPSPHNVIQLLREIRRRYPGVTAIVTDSDDDAMRMIIAAKNEKIRFPEEICITGFGNVHGISNYFPLATIDQHPARMGAVACEQLISVSSNGTGIVHEELDVEPINFSCIPDRAP